MPSNLTEAEHAAWRAEIARRRAPLIEEVKKITETIEHFKALLEEVIGRQTEVEREIQAECALLGHPGWEMSICYDYCVTCGFLDVS